MSGQPKTAEQKLPDHEDVIDYFNETYGTDASRLEKWQQLCRDLSKPAGPSITQCKKVSKKSKQSQDRMLTRL